MEENAFLSNITTILTKDVLIDNGRSLLKPKHFRNESTISMDDDSDGEAIEFFMKQMKHGNRKLKRKKSNNSTKKSYPKSLAKSIKYEDEDNDDDEPIIKDKRIRVELSNTQKQIELNLVNKFEAIEFEGYLHLSKLTFLKLFQAMRGLLNNTNVEIGVAPHSVFSLSLWKLTTDEHYEEITRKFEIAFADCQLIIRHFWNLIDSNYKNFVNWPSKQIQEAELMSFQAIQKMQVLRNVFGVVIIKRLDIFLEYEDEEASVILQIICNADQKVIDCYVELAKDYSFDESPIGKALANDVDTMLPNRECYLIGDKNLPLRKHLMCPIETPMNQQECTFNNLLQPAIALSQQVLDAMAKRFNILYALEAKDLEEVRQILVTVCALHNLCVDIEDDYIERKREVIKFNWATADGNVNIIGKPDDDETGIQRRKELMHEVVK